MLTRSQNIRFYSLLSVFLLLVVLVLASVAAARSSVRVDLTEEGIYTLSDASSIVLESLEDPVTIRVFWHNVPQGGETAKRYIDSLLREMRSAARGKLTVRWVDIEDEAGEEEATKVGIQKRQFTEFGEGELTVAEGYDGLVVEVADESETVPYLATIGERVEYEIISRLHRMTRTDDVVVGLVAPRPAYNPFGGGAPTGRFRKIENDLRQLYGSNLRSQIDLAQPVPADLDVLVVAGPVDYDETKVWNFEQFLLGGGRAILLLDSVHAPAGRAPNREAEASGFEEWLTGIGITVESGVVGDWARGAHSSVPLAVGSGLWTFRGYAYWPVLLRGYLNQENPATRGFDGVPLYWPAALSIDPAKAGAEGGPEITVLATTSNGGYRRPDLIGLEAVGRNEVTAEDLTPHIPLIALVEGKLDSFWKGRPVPGAEKEKDEQKDEEPGKDESSDGDEPEGDKPEGDEPEGDEPEDAKPEGDESESEESEGDEPKTEESEADPPEGEDAESEEEEGPPRLDSGSGLLVLFTDAELISDDAAALSQLRPGYAFGFEFIINMVDWMGGSEELLALRARAQKDRFIQDIEPKDQRLIKWGHTTVIPLLTLLAGIVVFIVRRYQR